MLKPVVVAAAALAIAGSSIVYAQQRFNGPGGDGQVAPRSEQHYRPSAQDMAAFTDARIAALRAGLQLTPDQAKNWPPFEQALRDMAKLRIERMQAHHAGNQQDQAATTPFDRLARHADAMAKTGAALKQIADTGMPLYQSLDDAQKRRFSNPGSHVAAASSHARQQRGLRTRLAPKIWLWTGWQPKRQLAAFSEPPFRPGRSRPGHSDAKLHRERGSGLPALSRLRHCAGAG